MMLVRGLVKFIPAVARLFLPGPDWVLLNYTFCKHYLRIPLNNDGIIQDKITAQSFVNGMKH